MKIAHIVKSSHNIGEGALINGMHNILRVDINKELEFDLIDRKYFQAVHGEEYNKDSVSKRFDKEFIDFLNKKYDLLIIGGGGIIQTGKYENFGGLVLAGDLDSFNLLKIPMVVYAAGDNRFSKKDSFEYGEELSKLVKYISDSSKSLFSLRNDLSKERIIPFIDKKLHQNVNVIPDPGFYIKVDKQDHPLIRKDKKNIVIQLAGDRIAKRIKSSNDRELYIHKFLSKILNAIEIINNNFSINVILSPHIPADFFLINKLIEIGAKKVINGSGIIRELFDINFCTRGEDMASNFFTLYDQADVVIGMRGHSAICSIGLSTPFISIDSHPKVVGVMNEMNLSNYSLDPSSESLDTELSNIIKELILDPNPWHIIRNKSMIKARQKSMEFHKLISDII